jgi:hypothetical protein
MDAYSFQHTTTKGAAMLHPPMLMRPLNLHRAWHDRLWVDAFDALRSFVRRAAAAWAERRRHRLELEEWRAAVELDERVLRDIGAPQWLQSQAESVRESRRLERGLMHLEVRRELRHFR